MAVYEFTFPFRPPMEDCRMEFTSKCGAKVYVFDTFCKNQTPEEKQQIDADIVRIYNDILVKEALRQQESKG